MQFSLILLIFLFIILVVLGMPIAMGLALSGLTVIMFTMDIPLYIILERLLLGVDSHLLMAIPLFVLAANVMNYSGVTDRIFGFARVLVGTLPGALGHANVLASVIFAGMSGSAIADSAALGKIEIKSMKEQGYPTEYAAAITCASATIGPIFPPSIPLVIYAGIAGQSVGALFLGGVFPGLLIALTLMLINHFIAKKRNYPRDEAISPKQILKYLWGSLLPILTPVFILVSILMGLFTPTEVAAFTVLYAFVLGFFIYRSFKLSMIPKMLVETIVTSGVALFIIATASIFSWVLLVGGLGTAITEFAANMPSTIIFLIVINVILLLLGMVMESTAILMIVTPFLIPVATLLGIDLVHFGVMIVLNLMIGLSTPPFGLGLFTVSQVAELPIESTAKAILPFIPVLIIALIIIVFVPQIVTWLPSMIK